MKKIWEIITVTFSRASSILLIWGLGFLLILAGEITDKLGGFEPGNNPSYFGDFTPGDWVTFIGFMFFIVAAFGAVVFWQGRGKDKDNS